MDSIPQHIVRDRFVGCFLFTEQINLVLMAACIPYSGTHSQVGQILNSERMIGLILKASGIHSRGCQKDG